MNYLATNPIVPPPWTLILLGLLAAYAAVFVIALVQIAKAADLDSTARAVWVLIVIIAPFLGAVAWFAIGRRKAPRVNR